MNNPTYTYYRYSSRDVGRLVAQRYDLGKSVNVKFYISGLHDNYLIETGDQKYMFRVYRNAWRSEEEVRFELTLLDYLKHKNAFVASPVLSKTNDLAIDMPGSEVTRLGALFHYAEGMAPGGDITPDQCRLLGKTVADVHVAATEFSTNHVRNTLELPYLLDASVTSIKTFIDESAQQYLAQLQAQLYQDLPSLPQDALSYGICIGDVNASNFHINNQNALTLFDFDQCGYGYRAFDIGKFISSLQHRSDKQQLAEAFVEGYQQVRTLNKVEIDAIPYYELIAVIWVMAIHAMNAEYIGYKNLEPPFWERRLAVVKRLALALANKELLA